MAERYEEIHGAATRAAMRTWFYDNLSKENRDGWLDAVSGPDSVSTELVKTLPDGRYPSRLSREPLPDHWVYAPSGSGNPARPGTTPHYRMTKELQEFLEREH